MTTGEATSAGLEWVRCSCGGAHWGQFGAAGLALVTVEPRPSLLLELRSPLVDEGGTWGLVGGARGRDESAVEAALREAQEEAGIQARDVRVRRSWTVAHGSWSYTYVIASCPRRLLLRASPEAQRVGWLSLTVAHRLPLHPLLAAVWSELRENIYDAMGGLHEAG